MFLYRDIEGYEMNTPEQVRQQFEAEGISIKEWARSKGYTPRLVYAVINGSVQCKRGKSHKIAVELGLKAVPEKRFLTERA